MDTSKLEDIKTFEETDGEVKVAGDNWTVSFDKKTGEMTSYQSNGKEMIAEALSRTTGELLPIMIRRNPWMQNGKQQTRMFRSMK